MSCGFVSSDWGGSYADVEAAAARLPPEVPSVSVRKFAVFWTEQRAAESQEQI